jgi:peroxiredoxin
MRSLVLALLVIASCAARLQAADTKNDLAARFDGVELRDCFGTTHPLSEYSEAKTVVVAFLGTECPLAKLYGPRLQHLSERFRNDGVIFLGVCSNVQDSLTEVAAWVNKSGISFPVLMDPEQQLADVLQATRTPEVIVLNQARAVQYRGRIDDQHGISIARQKATREDLAEALQSVIKGEEPSVATTPLSGCVIGRRNPVTPHGEITFTKHIAPIFNARCVECHRSGEIAPFPLTTFEESAGWEATIAEVVQEDRMPPWNANP